MHSVIMYSIVLSNIMWTYNKTDEVIMLCNNYVNINSHVFNCLWVTPHICDMQ